LRDLHFPRRSIIREVETLQDRPRRIRKQQRKLTQEELAFEAKIDLTCMGGIERGRQNPSLIVMARIADALGVALPKLLSD
jgi:transcriptional regulator with XRE-family HTH domain